MNAKSLSTIAFANPDILDIAEWSRLPIDVVAEEFIEIAVEGLFVSGAMMVDAQRILTGMIEQGLRERQEAAKERYNAAIRNDTLASLHRSEYYSERLTARGLV